MYFDQFLGVILSRAFSFKHKCYARTIKYSIDNIKDRGKFNKGMLRNLRLKNLWDGELGLKCFGA